MSKSNAVAREPEPYGALSAISPALAAESTVLSINQVLDSKPRLVPVSRGPLWKLIGDGTLETFRIGARRYTTLAMIAACNKKLVARGRSASILKRGRPAKSERARAR